MVEWHHPLKGHEFEIVKNTEAVCVAFMSLQRVREQQPCLIHFSESISTLNSQQKFTVKQRDYEICIFEQDKVLWCVCFYQRIRLMGSLILVKVHNCLIFFACEISWFIINRVQLHQIFFFLQNLLRQFYYSDCSQEVYNSDYSSVNYSPYFGIVSKSM